LSSLLLILLPVFAGVPDSERLFAICSLVVLVSIVLHGGSPMLLARIARRRALKQQRLETVTTQSSTQPAVTAEPVAVCEFSGDGEPCAFKSQSAASSQPQVVSNPPSVGAQSILIDELRQLWAAREPVTILDVRTERSIEDSDLQAKGAIRMLPDHVVERAKELGLRKEAWLIAYCA
jgi:NhaP-type Na+/H+ or K+/H+ antiporter